MKFKFNKFMNNILKKEATKLSHENEGANDKLETNPRRVYHQLYAEKWQNRVVWKKRDS